ncbi:MAG: hypothetical protein O3B13_08475 [Planctomycetota bacterium]|nr:hypothetical protein [Planctomycetota bacterium]MDA1163121.1 hypothetical protein [Planctomycetota bacterium]
MTCTVVDGLISASRLFDELLSQPESLSRNHSQQQSHNEPVSRKFVIRDVTYGRQTKAQGTET